MRMRAGVSSQHPGGSGLRASTCERLPRLHTVFISRIKYADKDSRRLETAQAVIISRRDCRQVYTAHFAALNIRFILNFTLQQDRLVMQSNSEIEHFHCQSSIAQSVFRVLSPVPNFRPPLIIPAILNPSHLTTTVPRLFSVLEVTNRVPSSGGAVFLDET